MLAKTIDEIVAAYPWPPLTHEANFRQLLSFIAADNEIQDQRWVAYVLATVRHETGFTYAPVQESGLGAGHPYGIPDPATGQTYYGRGYVQITWKNNYEAFSDLPVTDLVLHPELALDPPTSYQIASLGMRLGKFTGVGLQNFIHDDTVDYVNARKIINGLDQAETIAQYAQQFAQIL
jgi:predicted chitinase